jgi:hypothetical protein
MFKVENTRVHGIVTAVLGARNAMSSWERSDSERDGEILGKDDLRLAKQLVKAGTDHSKFMRMIDVSCNITAPMYWWKEMDTYKVSTVRNSTSTMHKIHAREIVAEDFSIDMLDERAGEVFGAYLDVMNQCRKKYIDLRQTKPEEAKQQWKMLIQMLPSSYDQMSTWHANYAVLANIYHARKNHKLTEWHTFCDWIRSLPYSELITGEENG